jgi:hypothetical protein
MKHRELTLGTLVVILVVLMASSPAWAVLLKASARLLGATNHEGDDYATR